MKYNIHTHIFNIKCAPENFLFSGFAKTMSEAAPSFWLMYYLTEASGFIQKNLNRVFGNNDEISGQLDFFRKYAGFLKVGRERNQELVFDRLRNTKMYATDTRFIVLTMDFDYMGAGKSKCNYMTQLAQVIKLKKKYPDTLLPFFAVDPRRGNSVQLRDLVRRHVEDLGFIGIKMYPALGFYPYDPRLEKIYEYAQDMQLPVMTHCTKSGVYYKGQLTREHLRPLNINPHPCKKNYTTIRKNSIFKNNFSHPDNYRDVLDLFPDLKLCIAHYGGSSQMRLAKNDPGDTGNWYYLINELIEGKHFSRFYNEVEHEDDHEKIAIKPKYFKNVYTDISYTLSDKKIYDLLRQNFSDDKRGRKILFGTDYYMTVMEKDEYELVYDFYKAFREDTFRGLPLSEMLDENAQNFLQSKVFKA